MNLSRKNSSRLTLTALRSAGWGMGKPSSHGNRGFTIVELIVGTIIGLVVVAVAGIGLQAAAHFLAESRAYSVASRSANTSFEFMPWKEIEKASAVEILDLPHDINEGVNEGWIYVSLDHNSNEPERGNYLAVIRSEDGHLVEEPVPGSEHINSLSFEGKVFRTNMTLERSNDAINKNLNGARVLITHIGVTSAVDNQKTRVVTRDRSLAVRKAPLGITRLDEEELPATDNASRPLLRYRMGGDEETTLFVYNTTNTGNLGLPYTTSPPPEIFSTTHTTWHHINEYNQYMYVDAILTLPQSVQSELDPDNPPVFTLIGGERSIFPTRLDNEQGLNIKLKDDPATVAAYDDIPASEKSDAILKLLKAHIQTAKLESTALFNLNTESEAVIDTFLADPFNEDDTYAPSRGFKIMAVVSSTQDGLSSKSV